MERSANIVISSEIIQTDDKFSKIESTFSEVNPGYPHVNISNFKKYILRLILWGIPRTQHPRENPITEEPKEEAVTEDPK